MINSNYFTPSELKFFLQQNPIFTEEQMKFINRKTPESAIEQNKDDSGNEFKSVKSSYVKALVTLVTGGNYSFEIKEQAFLSSAKEIRTTSRLTIYSNGMTFSREQNGKSKCTSPNADSYKASASDSFKKCASEFGFCWDIYTQEAIEVEKEPELNHQDQVVFDRLEINFVKCKTPEQLEGIYEHFENNTEVKDVHKILFAKHQKRLLQGES